jgi:GTPase involved in cell partitioning and DNA repair
VHFKASRGQHGGGSDMQGRTGKDTTVTVPRGTIIRDEEGTVRRPFLSHHRIVNVLRSLF